MRVWVLFRLQIESPICSEKEFTSPNMFIKLKMKWPGYEFLTKTFFPKSWASKLGVRLICECGLYAGIYGTQHSGFSIRAGRRRNSSAISHELAAHLIEKLPYILWRNICHKTHALDWPRFIHEKQKNLAWILSNFSGDLCFLFCSNALILAPECRKCIQKIFQGSIPPRVRREYLTLRLLLKFCRLFRFLFPKQKHPPANYFTTKISQHIMKTGTDLTLDLLEVQTCKSSLALTMVLGYTICANSTILTWRWSTLIPVNITV